MKADYSWFRALESLSLIPDSTTVFVWPAPYGDPRIKPFLESRKIEKIYFANGGEGRKRQEEIQSSHEKFVSLDIETGEDVYNYDVSGLSLDFNLELARDPAMAIHHNPDFMDAMVEKDEERANKIFRKILYNCTKASAEIVGSNGASVYDTDHFGMSPSMSNPKLDNRKEHLEMLGSWLGKFFSRVRDFEPDNTNTFFVSHQ